MKHTQYATLTSALFVALNTAAVHAEKATNTQLKNVIVTANHTAMSQHSVTANATVITAEDIAENHYRTLDDALRSIPGIQFVRSGGLGTNTSIFMRGQSGGSVLVLVNGVEMNNPMGTDSSAILSALLLSNIERIEVLKGPQSGIWGANASAGVINIITKQPQEGTQGSIDLETGDNNYHKLAFSLSSAEEKGDFAVSFAQLNTDGFSAVKSYKSYEQNYEDDAFNQTDFSLNTGINLSAAHRLEVLLKTAQSTTDYDFPDNPNQSDFASMEYENTIRRLQYVYAREQFNTTLYVSQNEIQQYNEAVINSVGMKGGYQYATDQSLAFVLSNNQYQNLSNGDSYYNTGVGLTNTNHFNDKKLIVTQSLRSDSYNQFDDKVTGKLGIKNIFNKDSFISANVGTAYNSPTLFQLTYNATTDLQPEETVGFDITLGLYKTEISYYQSRAKNFINYGGIWPNDYYKNLDGITRFEGVEFAYNDYFERANTQVNLTFAQVAAKDDNNQFLARRAEQTISLNLVYDGINNLTIGLNNRYIGNRFDKENRSGANIGDYYVTDLTINYTVNKNLTVYTNLLNLFDSDHTHAVATYQADNVTPQNVYSNGGSQLFVGLQGTF